MSFYFSKSLVANSAAMQSQFGEVQARRATFQKIEESFGSMHGMQCNAAAVLPRDAWRDFDTQTKALMVGDEGGVLLNDLMPLAKSVPIGKIVSEYRKVSDSGAAQSSLSGQLSKGLDKATYDYEGALVLIHDSAFGREWREVEAQRSEGFDGIADDQANAVRAVRRQMVGHIVDGVADVKFKGYSAPGIKTSSNVVAFDLEVDLTSSATTYAQIEAVFISMLSTLQGRTNNVDMDITVYVSPEIWFNLLRKTDNSSLAVPFLDVLRRLPGIKDIKRTNKLSGNEFFGIPLSSQYIQPVMGMAVTTTPVQRLHPFADVNFLTWSACGLLIKQDGSGRKGVLWARPIA